MVGRLAASRYAGCGKPVDGATAVDDGPWVVLIAPMDHDFRLQIPAQGRLAPRQLARVHFMRKQKWKWGSRIALVVRDCLYSRGCAGVGGLRSDCRCFVRGLKRQNVICR